VAEPPHRWWPATSFGLGWFGHTQAGCLGAAEPPPVAQGVVRLLQTGRFGDGRTTPSGPRDGSAPLGPIAQIFFFLGVWPKGRPNHPRPNGVAGHHLWGGSATPNIFFFIFSFFFKKKKKKNVMGAFWE
jgi:hypothetical protein